MRRFYVRFIAVLFIIVAIWNILLFFHGIFFNHYGNLTFLFNSIVLISAGERLYSFREFGRKLAIGIFGLHLLLVLFYSYLAFSSRDFGFSINALGFSYETDSQLLYAAVTIPLILIDICSVVVLLDEKTRLIFKETSEKSLIEQSSPQ